MKPRDHRDLSRRDMDELILHNQSFAHSYLVNNPRDKVFIHEILRTSKSAHALPVSEKAHLEELNQFAKHQFDFSTSKEEKEKVKVMKGKCKQ